MKPCLYFNQAGLFIDAGELFLIGFRCIFVLLYYSMKKCVLILFLFFLTLLVSVEYASAQCSICTKTTQQLGEKPAKGMNSGILYLAFAPFAIVGYIGYRWWQNNKQA